MRGHSHGMYTCADSSRRRLRRRAGFSGRACELQHPGACFAGCVRPTPTVDQSEGRVGMMQATRAACHAGCFSLSPLVAEACALLAQEPYNAALHALA